MFLELGGNWVNNETVEKILKPLFLSSFVVYKSLFLLDAGAVKIWRLDFFDSLYCNQNQLMGLENCHYNKYTSIYPEFSILL